MMTTAGTSSILYTIVQYKFDNILYKLAFVVFCEQMELVQSMNKPLFTCLDYLSFRRQKV